ncbi:uncharacterized protein LOC141854092 [Brevipalpus obovatus]|uniref:uncharacterized protein LOC141854092 n=1 Tax=Brevipalpus obovatus TaxID=246614 RepID=UPI003D9EDF5E
MFGFLEQILLTVLVLGVVVTEDRILVPKWCVAIKNENRGRIAIYAPKPAGRIASFSRSNPSNRYDEMFELVYENDDLTELIVQIAKGTPSARPLNTVALKIPADISHMRKICMWKKGDLFDNRATSVVMSWKRNVNGEFFLTQKIIDEVIKKERSFENIKKGAEDIAEAVFSVYLEDLSWVFDGFFLDPPAQKLE